MQDVADSLGISRVTVWKALKNHPGVSEDLNAQIWRKAEEMGYFKKIKTPMPLSIDTTSHETKDSQFTVSVVVARPESSLFWMNIIHQIAKELDKANINLMYTYLPSQMSPGYTLPKVLTNGSIHGMIILNVYDFELLTLLNNLNVHKVFLDMSPLISTDIINGDLFLLEGRSNIYKITDRLIKSGCSTLGFIGDTKYALTNEDRYQGFLEAMAQNNIPVNSEQCLTGNIGIYTYFDEINYFLQNLKQMPDALICASDYVAHFVLQFLNNNGYHVPDDVAISGFDGSTEYPGIAGYLTTVEVQTRDLGTRLASQIIYRMNHPTSPVEITYIKSNIIYGDTTK
jgi:LacI family transcriptional regulator